MNLRSAEPVASQLVDIVTARNNDGYEGQTIALSEAEDFAELVKQMRADLGDEPIAVYEGKMAEIAVARAAQAAQARAERTKGRL